MRLPINTSDMTFLVAGAPSPVRDFATKRQKADENGEPLFQVRLAVLTDEEAEIIAVKVPGEPPRSVRNWAIVTVEGLVALPWTLDGRSGVAYRAASITPITPAPAQGSPRASQRGQRLGLHANGPDGRAVGAVGRLWPESAGSGLRLVVQDELGVARDRADLRGAARRAERVVALGEEGRVRLGERLPLGGDVVLVEDRLDGADRLAGATVDALVRVDVEHPFALVDAIDRAFLNARLVLHVDARLGDHVRHVLSQPPRGLRALAESVPGTPPRLPLPGGNFSWWSRHPTGCWHLTGPEPAASRRLGRASHGYHGGNRVIRSC